MPSVRFFVSVSTPIKLYKFFLNQPNSALYNFRSIMYQYNVTTYPRKINCSKKLEGEQQASLYIVRLMKISDRKPYLLRQSLSHLHHDIFFMVEKIYLLLKFTFVISIEKRESNLIELKKR